MDNNIRHGGAFMNVMLLLMDPCHTTKHDMSMIKKMKYTLYGYSIFVFFKYVLILLKHPKSMFIFYQYSIENSGLSNIQHVLNTSAHIHKITENLQSAKS